jgi:S1-C subfamily serine protease
MEKRNLFTILICFCWFLTSCNSSNYIAPNKNTSSTTDHYTTQFPQREVSDLLQQAQNSILRIVTTAYYRTYTFQDQNITLSDIKTNNPEDIATDYFSTEESTAGTSIVLRYTDEKILLISCDHVVSSPDTVIAYAEGQGIPENTYVESISIKQRQNNLIFTTRQLQSFDIIASNQHTDLALFTAQFDGPKDTLAQPLDFTLGNSAELKLGSFLYVLGFPRGYPMVTRGLASTTENRTSNFFITDALFNPGISGGLVLASKDDFRSFQWVGIARSASASTENILVPQPTSKKHDRAARPYHGTPFVKEKTRITYGITQTIPINTIKEFISNHQEEISRNGFDYSVDM